MRGRALVWMSASWSAEHTTRWCSTRLTVVRPEVKLQALRDALMPHLDHVLEKGIGSRDVTGVGTDCLRAPSQG